MTPEQTNPAPDTPELLDLGAAIGETSAYGITSGRTAAARAAAIARIHEEKLYRHTNLTWDDFCPAHLQISRAEADRILSAWREFGPEYFELAHLTRISPNAFRALAPAIHDGALQANGEAVNLTPANAARVANIVAEFRRGVTKRETTPTVARLEKRAAKLLLDFDAFTHHPDAEIRAQLTAALARLRTALDRLAQESPLAPRCEP